MAARMIKYPVDYDPITEYYEKIKSGEEVVSEKVRRTYEKLVFDLSDTNSEYYYSHKRANHVIEFVENFCKHSKGKMGGKSVVLELWEKALLAAVFGFVDIFGVRKYREAILIVGKKNGKSLVSSCVGLYLMIGDNEAGPEIYAVATKKDQSKIIWGEAKRMVKKSPALRKRIKPLTHELTSEFNDGIFKPLSSDSDTLDGLNVHAVMMDEIHQWKNGKALFDIMYDGTTAREQPLTFITSTAGTIREDIYDAKYEEAERVINGYFDDGGYKDDHFIAFVYELDKRSEWTDPSCWKLTLQLCLNGNAFALIVRNENYFPVEIYPLPASSVEAVYDRQGNLYLVFVFPNGKRYRFPYSDIVHLRQDFRENDIFGESVIPALAPLMEVVTTTDQGIIKAIKNSGVIRWLLKILTSTRPEDIERIAKTFADSYLSVDSESVGVAAVDQKIEAVQVTPTDYVPNAALNDRVTARIYALFGTNEKSERPYKRGRL